MKLQSQRKYGSGDIPRVMPARDTIRRIRPYMPVIGVTRVADTTGLDTLGMPVFSAIRPDDAGLAGISVYNGKGLTKAASKAGAMMEAVERYCAETWHGPVYAGTHARMVATWPGTEILDPAAMSIQQAQPYDGSTVLDWVPALDLITGTDALVPLAMVTCPAYGRGAGIWYSSSNGLASGNTIEEAVSHALAELIERDAYTIAAVRAELAPRVNAFLAALTGDSPGGITDLVDRSHSPSIRLNTVTPPVKRLIRLIEKDKSEFWLRSMTTDIGIPAFVASTRRTEDGTCLASGGFGCDPDATIAAIRAITEAAQGRNVQIQGVREDASAARANQAADDHVLWCHDGDRWIDFDEVPSYTNLDILDDITLMLDKLRTAGVKHAYAIDVSDPAIPAAVAKLVIPDLEAWFLRDFDANQSRLGYRARRYLTSRV